MAYSENNSPPKPSVVVVNDDTTQLNVLCGLLKKAGLEPVPFKSAETALAAMGQDDLPPVLIVTDLYMPGIDGWQFCRLLRSPEFARFNKTPILVVSATFSGDEPSRITTDLGANAFLRMPFIGQQFIEQVQALIKGEKTPVVLKVLVVEDGRLDSTRLLKALQAHGYSIDATSSYQEALSMIAQTAYDVAVLDYHLPDGFGDGLLKPLQENSPDCVCIMMTADPQPELALTWMKLGVSAYLQKPFEPEYLIAQCERARRERALLRVQDLLHARTRQLQESEEKYRGLIQYSSDPIFAYNPDETYRFVNEAFAGAFGKQPEEIIGKNPHTIFPYDEAEKRLTVVRQVFKTGRKGEIEVKVVLHTGEERYYLTVADPIKDEQGHVLYVTCTSKDITERKRTEEMLRESEEKYKILYESAGVGIGYYSPDGKVISYNLMAARHMGGHPEDFTGKSVNELFPPRDAEVYMDRIRRAAASNEMYEYEDKVELPGNLKCFTSVFTRILNSSNQVTGVQIISSDISKNKQAEAQLRESEEKYRLLVEYSSDLIWNLDAEGIFSYVSPSWEHVVGYLPSALIGTSFQAIVHPADLPACLEYLQRMTNRSEFAPTPQYRVRHGDGTWHWHEGVTTPVLGPENEFISVVGVSRDINERKLAEAAIRESEERYHLIDEASQDLIYSYDRQSRFTHANSSMCKMLGLAPEQILGKTHEELGFPNEQCIEWARLHQKVYETNTTVISETVTPIQGGEPQYFEVVLNPIHDETGAIIGIAGTTRDINAKKMAEKKINAQIEELRRWHNITLGREDRILELKREVNRLLMEAGKPLHYASVQEVKHE